jgi:hypothetical protein
MVRVVTKRPSPIAAPLTDDEVDELAAFLDEQSPLDLDGVLGMLHAVTVAPSMVAPSTWIRIVLPNGFERLDEKSAQRVLVLLIRLYHEVVRALKAGEARLPGADDVAGCESFATGYVAGAKLDDTWIGHETNWALASWAAYLSGRHDLVTPRHLAQLKKNPEESRATIRRDMGARIRSTRERFTDARRRAIVEERAANAAPRATTAR